MVQALGAVSRCRERSIRQLACHSDPDACRREHIARRLDGAEKDGTDYEARCPICGHKTFRVSKPRIRMYRHVWTCACKRCGCTASKLRVALLKLKIMGWCLGVYDGPVERKVQPDAAARMELVISDILATPHLKPAEMRLALAEAQGQKVPDAFGPFVKFCVSIGISRSRAQDLAPVWCRPTDGPPQTGGAGSDTSRSTGATAAVKPPRSEACEPPVLGNRTARFGHPDISDTASSGGVEVQDVQMPVLGKQTLGNNKNRKPAA